MERLDLVYKVVFMGFGASISYLWGGWSVLIQILLTFVVIDYISGMIASGIEGKLKSNVGFKGIAKKAMLFLVVAVAHQIDVAIGENHFIRDAVIFFYIANETLSIIENAGRIGVPIPEVLKRAVEILRAKGEK